MIVLSSSSHREVSSCLVKGVKPILLCNLHSLLLSEDAVFFEKFLTHLTHDELNAYFRGGIIQRLVVRETQCDGGVSLSVIGRNVEIHSCFGTWRKCVRLDTIWVKVQRSCVRCLKKSIEDTQNRHWFTYVLASLTYKGMTSFLSIDQLRPLLGLAPSASRMGETRICTNASPTVPAPAWYALTSCTQRST